MLGGAFAIAGAARGVGLGHPSKWGCTGRALRAVSAVVRMATVRGAARSCEGRNERQLTIANWLIAFVPNSHPYPQFTPQYVAQPLPRASMH